MILPQHKFTGKLKFPRWVDGMNILKSEALVSGVKIASTNEKKNFLSKEIAFEVYGDAGEIIDFEDKLRNIVKDH